MKRRIFVVASIMAVLGLAAAVYALNTGTSVSEIAAKASCCKTEGADSCPMKAKAKGGHMAEHASKSCCGDSCKMKHGERTTASHDGKTCCDCCGDSCPMKNAEGNSDDATAVTGSDSAKTECCGGACCCAAKKETEA
ncbi:MAG TPA: hypothetical protein PKD24_07645 [Pyrinomonadaceae bacterium]|nr:hypothetical protein [Pyrinomonadaceae bacterium]